jgi:cobalt-precorrin 5A hydrolase
VIVAGFGFRGEATADSLRDALARAGGGPIGALATARDKAVSPAFRALARGLGVPVRAIDPAALARQETRTQSAPSLAARGIGSVAEAAALAAAGPGARLLGVRSISADGMATCALAEGNDA